VGSPEGRALRRPAAFWVLAAVFLLAFFASTAASPLYGVYQRLFGFSAITLTAVFAVYVVALLVTLLAGGRLSDHLGRRPVIIAGLIISAGARSASGMRTPVGLNGTPRTWWPSRPARNSPNDRMRDFQRTQKKSGEQ
jgi:MFS family permease